jgi:hypothetical protein
MRILPVGRIIKRFPLSAVIVRESGRSSIPRRQ